MIEEESQIEELQDELTNWKKNRAAAAMDDDDTEFLELNKRVKEIEKQLETAEKKLEQTNRNFLMEETAKNARDLE
jgi:predicted  nucleic acid-binding Zn-ribbon protein